MDASLPTAMLFVPNQAGAKKLGRVDVAPASPDTGDCKLKTLEMECFEHQFDPATVWEAAQKLQEYALSGPAKTSSGPDYTRVTNDPLLRRVACEPVFTYPTADNSICPKESTALCTSGDMILDKPGLFLL